VSEANVRAIDRAREDDMDVLIATGRGYVESKHYLEAIGHRGCLIAAGGSIVCDAETGRTLRRSVMDRGLVVDVTRALLHHGHKVLLLKDPDSTGYDYLAVGPAELDPASQWWFETMPVRVRFVHEVEDDPHPRETVRVGAVASEHEIAPIASALADEIGDRGFLQHWAAVTESELTGERTHLLEVFNPDVDKWTMIERYCAERGIRRERVAAIGDGLNDVRMVREAALGIAMGNADDRVRAVADRFTESNVDDGVAGAIDRLLEGAW
jgi:hypothetical protein